MRVVARRVDWTRCPSAIAPFTKQSQTFLTVGKKYDVHAIAVFAGSPSLQIVDDLGYPSWEASWLFDIDDTSLPADWICTLLQDDPSMLVGPAFVVKNEEAYGAMVELHADQVDRFWQRLESLKSDSES
jgi:hypothetical protein